jgi:hypothetical protein
MRGYNPASKTWDRPLDLDSIFAIGDPETLSGELCYFVVYKGSVARRERTPTEELFLKLVLMHAYIQSGGFCDLFYQQYSLADCGRIEEALREMELMALADLFAEAKTICTGHREHLTEEDCQELDPFSLSEEEGKRFDEIGELFEADASEIYLLPVRLATFARKRQQEFEPLS